MMAGDDSNHSCSFLHYFMASFPTNAQRRIIHLTNRKLRTKDVDEIDVGDLLKFFGICMLITKFEFGSRSELWSRDTRCAYILVAALGESTGMGRNRFDEIWSCLTFSNQVGEQPEWMSHAAFCWQLVDDFVKDFNEHRRVNFQPSETVCLCIVVDYITHGITDLYR
jgi:hypothetical protein